MIVSPDVMMRPAVFDTAERWPELMTSSEVAGLLRVDRSTISRWRASGAGPPVTWLSSTTPRYQRAHVLEWLRQAAS
jgi:hypothetical protein